MLHAVLFNDGLGIATAVEGSAEDFGELLIKATDAQRLEANVLLEYLLDLVADYLNCFGSILLDVARDRSLRGHLPERLADFLSE